MIRAYDDYGNVIDMVEWERKVRENTLDDFQEWLKHQIVGIDNHSKEILVVISDLWELAIDVYKGKRNCRKE